MTRRNLLGPALVALLMCTASAAAVVLKPTHRAADTVGAAKLTELIPSSFGQWRMDPTVFPIQVAPDVRETLDKVYSDILSRTYMDTEGHRVMLSIAYGGEQSKDLQVHRPEVCYGAQGFAVTYSAVDALEIGGRAVPVKRLVAVQGPRNEPITYWIRVGDELVLTKMQQGVARVRQGLAGVIPDGILVRVSTIGLDREQQYRVQDQFISDLIDSLPTPTRDHLVGKLGS